MSSDSVTRLFAKKLQQSNSSIKDFTVRCDADGATLQGTVKKLVPVHFTIKGPVSTDGISLTLTATSMKADGIPIEGLLKLVGAELSSLIQFKKLKGIEVGKDSLSFFPEALANLKGHISRVSTSPEGLTLTYAPIRLGSSRTKPPSTE